MSNNTEHNSEPSDTLDYLNAISKELETIIKELNKKTSNNDKLEKISTLIQTLKNKVDQNIENLNNDEMPQSSFYRDKPLIKKIFSLLLPSQSKIT